MSESYCVILSTARSKDEADRLAEVLVRRGLAACVQVVPISSTYVWNGNLTRESEHLLLVKTASRLYPDVEKAILENHGYEVPEIVQLPIAQGLDRYLGWITANTKPPDTP